MTDPISASDIAQALLKEPLSAATVVMVGLSALATGLQKALTLRQMLMPKPAAREVQDEARATGAQIGTRVATLETRVASHGKRIDDLEHHDQMCEGKLHKRVDELAALLNRTSGAVETGMAHLTTGLAELRQAVINSAKGGIRR